MSIITGSAIGLGRKATITSFNNDGTISLSLDESSIGVSESKIKAPVPAAWVGINGEYLGGYPTIGSSVNVTQQHGGIWQVTSYNTNFQTYNNYTSFSLASEFKPGRLIGRVKSGDRFLLDPSFGFLAGLPNKQIQVNTKQNYFYSNLNSEYFFNNSGFKLSGNIKRDLFEKSGENFLNDFSLNKNSFTIGLDNTIATSSSLNSISIRNPPLNESRELILEFSKDYNFISYELELAKYEDGANKFESPNISRRNNQLDSLSLSLEFPNQLMEITKGTAVDLFGNILDLNRSILPIGKVQELSLLNSSNKVEAAKNIFRELRKSIAFHFEINARKEEVFNNFLPPDINSQDNYKRNRSKFFIDIDKEGQFKINVPASSETGNIGLITRYENYSTLLSKQSSEVSPNQFVKPSNYQDIYIDSISDVQNIKLLSSQEFLDGYASPIDRITQQNIKLGTAYHDITKVCSEFTSNANYLKANLKLINFDKNNRLNTLFEPFKKIISNEIIVSGPDANGGGRSGTISLDGHLSFNIGANTIDRQSLWIDTAGSVISSIGRDKNNLSYAASLDGDMILQIGGPGIGNKYDKRFADQNDAYRNGTLEIRVLNNGQMTIFRIGPEGVNIASPGTVTISSQQDIIMRSNSNILMEAENIVMYAETEKRIINRFPSGNTIG